MAVPKRKMSRCATPSRKSAHQALARPAHSLCPNSGATRRPHTGGGHSGGDRGRPVVEGE